MSASLGKYSGYPWDRCLSFSTGLYIYAYENCIRPDGCKLLLPFNIRSNWWTRLGSGEPLDRFGAFDGLYQPETSVINGEYVLLRIAELFNNWKGMIENGIGQWTRMESLVASVNSEKLIENRSAASITSLEHGNF
jgi:hypothetical protein